MSSCFALTESLGDSAGDYAGLTALPHSIASATGEFELLPPLLGSPGPNVDKHPSVALMQK